MDVLDEPDSRPASGEGIQCVDPVSEERVAFAALAGRFALALSLQMLDRSEQRLAPWGQQARFAFRQLPPAAGGGEQLRDRLVRPERIRTHARPEDERPAGVRTRGELGEETALADARRRHDHGGRRAPCATAPSSRASSRSRPSVGARRLPRTRSRERSAKKPITREA